MHRSSKDDGKSSHDHDLVQHLWVGFDLKVTLLCNLDESRQHFSARYADFVEAQEAIIDRVLSKLRANITHTDAR